MSKWKLSARSKRRLNGVHPDLKAIVEAALAESPLDFGITEGVRTLARQKELVASKASWTMNSRHLTGHAVDIVVYFKGKVSWHGGHYRIVSEVFKKVAKARKVKIEWGGDWKRQFDGPHFQLSRRQYPANVKRG